jgi:hypothetical protein
MLLKNSKTSSRFYLSEICLILLIPPTPLVNQEGARGRLRKEMVGDTGFEPVTSTVCKRHKNKKNTKQ